MKIHIDSTEQQTVFFIIIFLFILLATIKRNFGKSVLDIGVTNEIKGFAILAVVFAHIGYALSDSGQFLFPLSILGGVGVNLFLFLSGFGLTISALKKPLPTLEFYKKRIIKLFIPLWVSLIMILALDKIILNRIYSFREIGQSFIGFFPQADLFSNINSPLWFITLILFFYIFFPLLFKIKSLLLSALLLLLIVYLLLFGNFFSGASLILALNFVNLDSLGLYKLHFAAFPLGIILAYFIHTFGKSSFFNFFGNQYFMQVLRYFVLFAAVLILMYTAIHSGVGGDVLKEQSISLITCTAIIIFFVFKRFKFNLFGIFGLYSYEIYLIHWPLMSRFDIFFKFLPPYLAVSTYLLLFLTMGFLMQRFVNLIISKLFRV